jgi:hypothetical protein
MLGNGWGNMFPQQKIHPLSMSTMFISMEAVRQNAVKER